MQSENWTFCLIYRIHRTFVLFVVKAHDGDRGINNPIQYTILSGGNDLFAINEKTGVVYTRKTLDREDSRNQENGAYILQIQATEISKLRVGALIAT